MPDVVLSWSLGTRAPQQVAWALLSDTDRFNRAAGFELSFEERERPDGTVERVGSTRKYGTTVTWREERFEVVDPEWFRSERVFLGGPLERMAVTLRLTGSAEGTRIQYEMRLVPRSALLYPVVAADAALTLKGPLQQALEGAVRALDGHPVGYDPAPPPLTEAASRRLDRALATSGTLATHGSVALRQDLFEHIRHAPLPQQDRLSALALGAKWGLEPDESIRGFLELVRDGVLVMRLAVLCPSCQGPKTDLPALGAGPSRGHCPSCNVDYDLSYPDALSVTFRPAPEIRDFEVSARCIGSPARTPHEIAHQRLPRDAEIEWRVPLSAGAYRITADGVPGGASLEVRDGVRAGSVAVDVTEDGVVPPILRARPGEVGIAIRNRCTGLVRMTLARRWRPPFTLTAGRLLETPGAAELLPPEALAPGRSVETRRAAVVAAVGAATDAVDAAATLAERAPEVLWAADGAAVSLWPSFAAALDAAVPLARRRDLSVALHVGPVTVLRGGRVVPMGRTVDAALTAARDAGAWRVVLAPAAREAHEVREELARRNIQVRHGILQLAETKPPPPRATVDRSEVRRAGPYRLAEVLGEGGFGQVFAARRDGTDEAAVVKVLRAEVAADPAHAQRFFQEARLSSRIRHPNTVRVLDYGSTGDRLYLAMERLFGRELEQRLRVEGRVSVREAVGVARGMLEGLEEAHRQGIVHRDVKPANVFLCKSGEVKVIDFGIARALEEDERPEDAGLLLGTPKYMSPEQLDPEMPFDARSDVYAVGLVLYECLSGALPFEVSAENPWAEAYVRLTADPVPLSERVPDLPPGLVGVVMRALQLEPEDRWGSCREMADALAPYA